MRNVLKVLIVSISCILAGCNINEVHAMDFCPAEIEQEARETLGLGETKTIKLKKFLSLADSMNLVYEVYKYDNKPLNCADVNLESDFVSYMVYAGFNETKEYKKAYLVVANSIEGELLYIDKRYMYKVPAPF